MATRLPLYEATVEFTASSGVTWRRTGTCNQCGACCRTGNPFPALTPSIEGVCAYYSESDGKGFCQTRDHFYGRQACGPFPQKPEQIAAYPDCSYRFERVS